MLQFPWALLGLLSVPLLLAIYWLQRRYRTKTVSSLFLWVEQAPAKQGGRRWVRLRTPALFWLELLALLLLTLAAARPQMLFDEARRPLAVVLDDSYSMLAGGSDTPRQGALQALQEELDEGRYHPFHLVLAAERPQLLAESISDSQEALKSLDGWKCQATSADLEAAAALARRLAGPLGRVLVLTDHAPNDETIGESRLHWAFGRPLPNLAFINAGRSSLEGRDRCLLEIANLSRVAASAQLTLEDGPDASSSKIDLQPGEVKRLILNLSHSQADFQARLQDDALPIDNRVILLAEDRRLVRAQIEIRDPQLRQMTESALQAGRNSLLVQNRPQLIFSDSEHPQANDWTVRFISEPQASAYTGPFVVDRNHPLTEGLSLEGAIWGAGKSGRLTGIPLISAGDVPLLSVAEGPQGSNIQFRLRPDLSNLQLGPAWPVLIWNMVDWRAKQLAGMERTNLRIGDQATARLPESTASQETAEVLYPDGTIHSLALQQAQLALPASQAGIYTIEPSGVAFRFAANALRREESDLSAAASGRWGQRLDKTALDWEYGDASWIPLLLALAALGLHGLLAWGRRGEGRVPQ